MTGHARSLPTGDNIARVMRRLLGRIFADGRKNGLFNGATDFLYRWTPTLAETMEPLLIPLWQRGFQEGVQSIKRQMHLGKGVAGGLVIKRTSGKPVFQLDLDLFNPRILEKLKAEVFTFCRSTLDTVASDVADAFAKLRADLGEGLEQGEAYAKINRRVFQIFKDPARAARIGQTESSRAVHGGQYLADKESGIVEKKKWLASSDACDLCLSLNGKEVGLDEPFWVNPKGGPYAVVMYPPVHPHCFCSYLSLIG